MNNRNSFNGASTRKANVGPSISIEKIASVFYDLVKQDKELVENSIAIRNGALIVNTVNIYNHLIKNLTGEEIDSLISFSDYKKANTRDEKEVVIGQKISDLDSTASRKKISFVVNEIEKTLKSIFKDKEEVRSLLHNNDSISELVKNGISNIYNSKGKTYDEYKSDWLGKSLINISKNKLNANIGSFNQESNKTKEESIILSYSIEKSSELDLIQEMIKKLEMKLNLDKESISSLYDIDEEDYEDYIEDKLLIAETSLKRDDSNAKKAINFIYEEATSRILSLLSMEMSKCIANSLNKSSSSYEVKASEYLKILASSHSAYDEIFSSDYHENDLEITIPQSFSLHGMTEYDMSNVFKSKLFFDYLPVSSSWDKKIKEFYNNKVTNQVFNCKFTLNGKVPGTDLSSTRYQLLEFLKILYKCYNSGEKQDNNAASEAIKRLPRIVFMRALTGADYDGTIEGFRESFLKVKKNLLPYIEKEFKKISKSNLSITDKNLLRNKKFENLNKIIGYSSIDSYMQIVAKGVRGLIQNNLKVSNDSMTISLAIKETIFDLREDSKDFIIDIKSKDNNLYKYMDLSFIDSQKNNDKENRKNRKNILVPIKCVRMVKSFVPNKKTSIDTIQRIDSDVNKRLLVFPIISSANSKNSSDFGTLKSKFYNNFSAKGVYVILPRINIESSSVAYIEEQESNPRLNDKERREVLLSSLTYIFITNIVINRLVSIIGMFNGFSGIKFKKEADFEKLKDSTHITFIRLQENAKEKFYNQDDYVVSATQSLVNELSLIGPTNMQGVVANKLYSNQSAAASVHEQFLAGILNTNSYLYENSACDLTNCKKKVALISMSIRPGYRTSSYDETMHIAVAKIWTGDVQDDGRMLVGYRGGFTEDFSDYNSKNLNSFSNVVSNLYSMGYTDIAIIEDRFNKSGIINWKDKVDNLSHSLYSKLLSDEENYKNLSIYPMFVDKVMAFKNLNDTNRDLGYEIFGQKNLDNFSSNYINAEERVKQNIESYEPIYLFATLNAVNTGDKNIKSHRGFMTYFLVTRNEYSNLRNRTNRILTNEDIYNPIVTLIKSLHYGSSEIMPRLRTKNVIPVLEPIGDVQSEKGSSQRSEIVIHETRRKKYTLSLASIMHHINNRVMELYEEERKDSDEADYDE